MRYASAKRRVKSTHFHIPLKFIIDLYSSAYSQWRSPAIFATVKLRQLVAVLCLLNNIAHKNVSYPTSCVVTNLYLENRFLNQLKTG
jgi:hypothetical protein